MSAANFTPNQKGFTPNQKGFISNQKGTALITVILIAAFVIVLVVEAIKTIQFQQKLSSNLINRDQAYSYLMGMEELAKILLKRAFEAEKSETVHLNQLWAQDDITFPIDGGIMTATIKDLQSCFNLNSIALPSQNNNQGQNQNQPQRQVGQLQQAQPQNQVNTQTGQSLATPGQEILEEIISQTLENTEVQADELAISVRDWIDEDFEPADHRGAEDDYYQAMDPPYRTPNGLIAHSSELVTIKGWSHKTYDQIKPFVCVLPDDTEKVNVNTVDEENAVIVHATLDSRSISIADVKRAISNRPEDGFESVDEFLAEFGIGGKSNDRTKPPDNTDRLGVTSKFFEVSAQAEIGGTRVAMKTLFEKDEQNNFKIVSRYFGKE